jgi:hypothetical protein
VSQGGDFLAPAPNEAVKMLLAAVSVAVVLYWIMQGYLAARMKVEVSGEAYGTTAQNQRLVLASVRIANIGNSNASIEKAALEIFPGDSKSVCNAKTIQAEDLSFASRPGDKNPVFVRMGLDSQFYTIVWGTEEIRQAAMECPLADFYRLSLDVRVRQAFSNSIQTWRASAIIPTQPSAGKSPSWAQSEAKTPGITEGARKLVTTEDH